MRKVITAEFINSASKVVFSMTLEEASWGKGKSARLVEVEPMKGGIATLGYRPMRSAADSQVRHAVGGGA